MGAKFLKGFLINFPFKMNRFEDISSTNKHHASLSPLTSSSPCFAAFDKHQCVPSHSIIV